MKQHVTVGDRLVVRGHHVGESQHDGEVIEVLGEQGPYRVRWSEDGHESILYPGSDVYIDHFPATHKPRS